LTIKQNAYNIICVIWTTGPGVYYPLANETI